MQEFGSGWTVLKLDAVEGYLRLFTTALKNMHFRLCYIDAFAGSGSVLIKDGREIEGSAIRALKYPFDKYYFFETDSTLLNTLKEKVAPFSQFKDIEFCGSDCNEFLIDIDKTPWKKDKWRGVIFLDPFAMNLAWNCLASICATQAFDIWYLFPFSAVNRNLNKNGKIPSANRNILNNILGTEDWAEKIYYDDPQMNLFGEKRVQKVDTNSIKEYILNRLKTTFPTVSDHCVLLKNERQSPLFLLCFAGSNPNIKAKDLSLRLADNILSRM